MDNPPVYILLRDFNDLSDENGVTWFSNLDFGKESAVKNTTQGSPSWTIYKLVPMFKTSLKVTAEVIVEEPKP
jgi:hypothetical protein